MLPRPQSPTNHTPHPSFNNASRPPQTAPPPSPDRVHVLPSSSTPNPRKRRRSSTGPEPPRTPSHAHAPRRTAALASPGTAPPALRTSARPVPDAREPDYGGPSGQYVPISLAALGEFGRFFLPPRGQEQEDAGGEMVGEGEEMVEEEEGEDALPDIVTGEINAPGFVVFVRERGMANVDVARELAAHRAGYGEGTGWPFDE